MRTSFLLCLLAVAVPAHAQTASLKCKIEQSDGSAQFIFNLNEEQGRATYTVISPTRGSTAPQEKRALFTPEFVTIVAHRDQLGEMGFRISRTDLSFERFVRIAGNPPSIDRGTCALHEPPNQVF